MDTARTIIEQGWVPSPAEKQRILRARAQALARPAAGPQERGDAVELVEFALAHEHYAVESAFIREVFPLTDLAPLPCTPDFILGIVNLRGEIVSVIDLKKFFNLPATGITDLNRLILLHSANMTFGVLADQITGVRNVSASRIQSPHNGAGIRNEYLHGVTPEGIIVLDAMKLLSDNGMVVNETVEE